MSEASQPLLSGQIHYNGEAAQIAPAAPNRMTSTFPGKTNREYINLKNKINGDDEGNGFQEVFGNDVLSMDPSYYHGLLANIYVNNKEGVITPEQADQLYTDLSEKPVYKGLRLKKRTVDELRKVFENSSQGTSRDLNLLELQLKKQPALARQEIVRRFDFDNGVSLERILQGKQGIVAMMRICKFVEEKKLKSEKCHEFNNILSSKPSKYNDEINKLSKESPNMYEFTEKEFRRRFVPLLDEHYNILAEGSDPFMFDDASIFEQPNEPPSRCLGFKCSNLGLGGRTRKRMRKGMRKGTRKVTRKGMRKGMRKEMGKGMRKGMHRVKYVNNDIFR